MKNTLPCNAKMFTLRNIVYFLIVLVTKLLEITSEVPSNGYSQEVTKTIQDAMSCFTLATASKIMRSKLLEEDKNVLFSPLDLYTATALAHLGAQGESRKKLATVLGIKEPRTNVHARRRRQQPRSLEDIHRTIGALINDTKRVDGAAIQYGAGIYVYNDFAIKSTYIEDARNFYGIEVKCTDFKNQNAASTDLINCVETVVPSNRDPNPLWDWPLAEDENLTLSPANSHSDAENYARLEDIHDENYRPFVRLENRRNAIYSLQDETDIPEQSPDLLSAPSMIINLLQEDGLDQGRPRVVIVDHESGMRSNQNLFFDFFGGGDSPEAILEYYRRRVLSSITTEEQPFHRDQIDIAEKTYQRIPRFFLEPVSTETKSIIPSTLSFVAKWEHMFHPPDSYETVFHSREDGCDDTNTCLMMNLQTIPYARDTTCGIEAIAVPFRDPNLHFYILLPNKTSTLQQLVNSPNRNLLTKLIECMQPTKVKYHIPKMTLEAHVDQIQLLKESGMMNALEENDVADGLTLTNLEQVVEVELNEEGIGGCIVEEAFQSPSVDNVTDPEAIEFVVDKPYIFFVYHKLTKVFLLYGIAYKPLGYD